MLNGFAAASVMLGIDDDNAPLGVEAKIVDTGQKLGPGEAGTGACLAVPWEAGAMAHQAALDWSFRALAA
jgi:hypothetical protein